MIDEKIKEALRGVAQLAKLADDDNLLSALTNIRITLEAFVQAEALARDLDHQLKCFLTADEECEMCQRSLADYVKEVEAELSK